jgi:hypothetical protein
MRKATRKAAWLALGAGSAMAAGALVVVALAQVVAKQGAAVGWRQATGRRPPT